MSFSSLSHVLSCGSLKVSQKTSHNREEISYERPRKVHFEMHRRDMLEMREIKRDIKKSVYNIETKNAVNLMHRIPLCVV
jgi:hypothetical protein